jgi:hypothetical protein
MKTSRKMAAGAGTALVVAALSLPITVTYYVICE